MTVDLKVESKNSEKYTSIGLESENEERKREKENKKKDASNRNAF